jgi:uncharacterized membrane protein
VPPRDLEEFLGGRVLGWVGGIAVAVAAVFFVVMAVYNGWIGVPARMGIAFAASALLVGLGVWLYERRGQTQAALATVAAGLAALYASDAGTTLHYHLLPSSAGLVVAGLVGALALATAVRWDSQEIAGIGIVGSLLAPVFVDAGTHTSSLVFITIALLAAVGVAVLRRWAWLAATAYVVSVPQAAAWLWNEHDDRLWLTLVVATAFWLLYVAAAIGHELREPADDLRLSSASLLFVNASVTAGGVWWLIDDAGHRGGANAWLFTFAAAHLVLGALVLRSRANRDVALLLHGVGVALVGVACTVALDGPALVAAWSAEALVLAWVGRRTETPGRALAAALVLSGLSGGHVLVFEAPPTGSPGASTRSPRRSVRVLSSCSLSRASPSRTATARTSRSSSPGPGPGLASTWRAASWSTSPARTSTDRRRRRSSCSRVSGERSGSLRSSRGWCGAGGPSGSAASPS